MSMIRKETNKSKLILALGSNCDQEENIDKATVMLQKLFDDDIRFTKKVWTESIGIKSDMFINRLAYAHTSSNVEETKKALKNIETACGDNKEDRMQNVVRMDIDILLLGNEKFHVNDWSRGYIKELLKELT